jgi:hypothetical protein
VGYSVARIGRIGSIVSILRYDETEARARRATQYVDNFGFVTIPAQKHGSIRAKMAK